MGLIFYFLKVYTIIITKIFKFHLQQKIASEKEIASSKTLLNINQIKMSTKPKFQLSSIKYQNLSNRMQRLRHSSSQNHSNNNLNMRSSSVDRAQPINKTLNRNISSTLLINNASNHTSNHLSGVSFNNNLFQTSQDDNSCLDAGNRNLGRVTKNTGLKKYNQRMLKQIGNVNAGRRSPPKYNNINNMEQKLGNSQLKMDNMRVVSQVSPPHAHHYSKYQTQFDAKVHQQNNYKRSENKLSAKQQIVYTQNPQRIISKLQPGQIYSREELQKYFNRSR